MEGKFPTLSLSLRREVKGRSGYPMAWRLFLHVSSDSVSDSFFFSTEMKRWLQLPFFPSFLSNFGKLLRLIVRNICLAKLAALSCQRWVDGKVNGREFTTLQPTGQKWFHLYPRLRCFPLGLYTWPSAFVVQILFRPKIDKNITWDLRVAIFAAEQNF